MWILLPSGELKLFQAIDKFRPSDEEVVIEHREATGLELVTIAHTGSLAESERIVADIARQIAAGELLIRVPRREPAPDEDETALEPVRDLGGKGAG